MEKIIVNNNQPTHKTRLVLENRNILSLLGVTQVLNSNETTISVQLKEDKLQILGNNLYIEKFSVEEKVLEVSGVVNTLKFLGKSEGVFKRIFK